MDLQQQIAMVEQKQQQLLTQAEQARLVRQLGVERTSLFAQGYAAALRAVRGRKQELQEPISIRPAPSRTRLFLTNGTARSRPDRYTLTARRTLRLRRACLPAGVF